MRTRWRPLTDEQKQRAARSDPRQVSLFGDEHTAELIYQSEARKERRDFYTWKYSRRDPQTKDDF